MPIKKPGRPGLYVRITIPGFGLVGPWQTGMSSMRQAKQVEEWLLRQGAERPELIAALVAGRFGRNGLRKAWVARVSGTLDDLVAGLTDPPLAEAAEALARHHRDSRVADGLRELAEMAQRAGAGRRPRLSWLTEPRNVSALYAEAGKGRAPNTVRRSNHRAVADLLREHYGKARRDAVMADVAAPGANDERKVKVTGPELLAVLNECDDDFRDIPALAMLLAVDQSPLLSITPRFFHEADGTLEVLDRKTFARPRVIELSTPAWAILRRRCDERLPDARIFDYTTGQVRHRWEAARDRAAGVNSRNRRERGDKDPVRLRAEAILRSHGVVTLPLLRFKDLRHLLPTAWNALGYSEADLQPILGHARGSGQTRRYITERVVGDRKRMDRVAEYLGLDRLHLKAVGE